MAGTECLRGRIARVVDGARELNPLVVSITNNVSIDFVANAQLAVGGSAAMVYLADEARDLLADAGSLYVNLGTLQPLLERSIPESARAARDAGRPWVLDPVGLGIGGERTRILEALRDCGPAIVRGNASEIIGLAGLWGLEGNPEQAGRVRGVDSTDPVEAARSAAIALACHTGGAVAVSGAEDLVTDGRLVIRSSGGSALMSRVTGFGCSLGGVMAVYAAVAGPLDAALAAVALYNEAGSRVRSAAPAGFKTEFLDLLFSLMGEQVAGNPLSVMEG